MNRCQKLFDARLPISKNDPEHTVNRIKDLCERCTIFTPVSTKFPSHVLCVDIAKANAGMFSSPAKRFPLIGDELYGAEKGKTN